MKLMDNNVVMDLNAMRFSSMPSANMSMSSGMAGHTTASGEDHHFQSPGFSSRLEDWEACSIYAQQSPVTAGEEYTYD